MPGGQKPEPLSMGLGLLVRLPTCATDSDARSAEARSMDQREEATESAPQTTVPGNEQRTAKTNRPETVNGMAPRHTRVSAAWTAVAIAVLLGVALIAFIVQNTQKVQIKFFGASGHIPLVVALLAAAIIGALIVLVVGISRIIQLRLSARRRLNRTKESSLH
jgi:uncharacterized integral membrane protein